MQNRAIYKLIFTSLLIFAFFMISGLVFGRVVGDLLASFTSGGNVHIEGETIHVTRPPCSGTRGRITKDGKITCSERNGELVRTFGLAGVVQQTIPVAHSEFENWCRQQKILINKAKVCDFDYTLPEDFLVDDIGYAVDPMGLTVVAKGMLLKKHATMVVSWILTKERICRFTLLQVSERELGQQHDPLPILLTWRGQVMAANAK